MSTSRRYLIASSLARLIRKERGGNRVTEGHFPNQADRSSYVIVEGDKGSLVLITTPSGAPIEERTDVPRAHAEALLDVTTGKVDYVRSHLTVGTRDIHINRFVTPGPLDMISVEFESEEEARDFRPLSWFGPDVTDDFVYHNRSIALEGLPPVPDVHISNAALNSLLDTLENRYAPPRTFSQSAPARSQADVGEPRRNPPPPPAPPTPQAERPARKQAAPAREETADAEMGDDEGNDLSLNIEDNVIRELARSLRPQRR
jgi:CYTH domain-containing protein